MTDLPLDSSPWQKRAGVPFSHIACPRPPQSYSGYLSCPWFVRQMCIVDGGMDCIQHPIRGAAESKTGKKKWPNTCADPVRFIQLLLSYAQFSGPADRLYLTGLLPKPKEGRAQPSLGTGTLIIGHAFLIFMSESHHSSHSIAIGSSDIKNY